MGQVHLDNLRTSGAPGGYVALVTVLVIGAIGVSIATSGVLTGLGNSRSSGTLERSAEAKSYANACAETALQLIWDTDSFTGSGGLSLGNGSCTYTVTNTGGENRAVAITGVSGDVTRRALILVNEVTANVGVTSWLEVPS